MRCSLKVLLSNRKSRWVTVTHLFIWNTREKFCDSYTAEFHMLQIVRQILWLSHQRLICLNVWKFHSAIFDYKVKFLNKKICSINCGCLKETLWQYVTIFMGFSPKTLKYWVGVQRGHSYLMGRRCLFSLGWPPF